MHTNLHCHTWRCNHAQPDERAYVERAIEGGMKTLGFSDHTPYPTLHSGFRMEMGQFEDYVNTVLTLKEEYKNDIKILLGLEVEYYPALFGQLLDFLKDYPVEYMLLGQHFIGNEVGMHYSGNPTIVDGYLRMYCNQVIEAFDTGCFTYLAHPDLFYYRGDKETYQKEMKRICIAAKEKNIPLEINFLGLMDGRNYPNPLFWELAGEVGNEVIFGCDAHRPTDTWQPEAEKRAMEEFVHKYGLKLIESCELVPVR